MYAIGIVLTCSFRHAVLHDTLVMHVYAHLWLLPCSLAVDLLICMHFGSSLLVLNCCTKEGNFRAPKPHKQNKSLMANSKRSPHPRRSHTFARHNNTMSPYLAVFGALPNTVLYKCLYSLQVYDLMQAGFCTSFRLHIQFNYISFHSSIAWQAWARLICFNGLVFVLFFFVSFKTVTQY